MRVPTRFVVFVYDRITYQIIWENPAYSLLDVTDLQSIVKLDEGTQMEERPSFLPTETKTEDPPPLPPPSDPDVSAEVAVNAARLMHQQPELPTQPEPVTEEALSSFGIGTLPRDYHTFPAQPEPDQTTAPVANLTQPTEVAATDGTSPVPVRNWMPDTVQRLDTASAPTRQLLGRLPVC